MITRSPGESGPGAPAARERVRGDYRHRLVESNRRLARTLRRSTTTDSRSNFSLSSACHWVCNVARANTRDPLLALTHRACVMTMPASMVFPSPTRSANMHPPRDKESMGEIAASS